MEPKKTYPFNHSSGPWKWLGEDYRGGWGWQLLLDSAGCGIVVGDNGGDVFPGLRSFLPMQKELCETIFRPHKNINDNYANGVHVFRQSNARLIQYAPEMYEMLKKIADLPFADDITSNRVFSIGIGELLQKIESIYDSGEPGI
jgi:hypothetical protein